MHKAFDIKRAFFCKIDMSAYRKDNKYERINVSCFKRILASHK